MTNKYNINIDNRYSIDKSGNVVFNQNGSMNIYICWDRESYQVWIQFESDGKMARTGVNKVVPDFNRPLETLIQNFVAFFAQSAMACANEQEDFSKHVNTRAFIRLSGEVASWVIRPIICDVMNKELKKYEF
ncbi:MAG: hypothetical protein IJG38_00120 [Thermoguttaceae bacterium]|nr:hypothetical protein [Thermoguttaceae bacterium]